MSIAEVQVEAEIEKISIRKNGIEVFEKYLMISKGASKEFQMAKEMYEQEMR